MQPCPLSSEPLKHFFIMHLIHTLAQVSYTDGRGRFVLTNPVHSCYRMPQRRGLQCFSDQGSTNKQKDGAGTHCYIFINVFYIKPGLEPGRIYVVVVYSIQSYSDKTQVFLQGTVSRVALAQPFINIPFQLIPLPISTLSVN